MDDFNDFLRTVKDLICSGRRYYIPAYQRGYRWRAKKEVHRLLGDICSISTETYCLQPIVVSKREDGSFEVIDGQQRLTTLYLLCKCLGGEWASNICSISYATRTGSAEFLEQIGENHEGSYDNVDFFFMVEAYKEISAYENLRAVAEKLPRVQAIWYLTEDEGEALFVRLNSYRIPLTNAELIRALFLKTDGDVIDTHRQFEMATEWDEMERELRNPAFWHFLTAEKAENYPSRLEFIFRIMAPEGDSKRDEFHVFAQFAEAIAHMPAYDIWQRVCNCYNTLHDWYSNHELYHLIGYLVAARSIRGISYSMRDLVNEWIPDYMLEPSKEKKNRTQEKICKELAIAKIRQTLPAKTEWDELSYESNKGEITNILLLFNILYMKDRGNRESRFPFDGYHKSQWSLEHIHPQHPDFADLQKHIATWWNDHRKFTEGMQLNDEQMRIIRKVCNSPAECTQDEAKALFELVMKQENAPVDERHELSNMALLQQHINSSLQNYAFSSKRAKILEFDKPEAGNKEFILPCTLNVFLKYYSAQVSHMEFWTKDDRKDYLETISQLLHNYLPA